MTIVDFADLQRISRLKSKAAVRRYLDKLKIRYRLGQDGAPWTTTEAINRVLLGPGPGYSAEPNVASCDPRGRRKNVQGQR
jgi:hypothetical protein